MTENNDKSAMESSLKMNNIDDISIYFAQENVDPLPYAFQGTRGVYSAGGGKQIAENDIPALVDELSHKERSGKSVAYIHVPFCETHCLYCGFYNKPYKKGFSKEYADTLIEEMKLWEGRNAYTSAPIHAIYMGGGTPTALEGEDLERILKATKQYLYLANDCEITVEGRLHNFGKDKMEACFRGGANRFSLGVQTFDTELRRLMRRIADKDTVCRQIEELQAYDQASVVIDLIYGFPTQTMDIWLEDIKIAQSLMLDGADCYRLKVFHSTPLGKAIEEGKIPASADIAEQSKYFSASVHAMQKENYKRLSISHWGRTTRERNLYNLYTKGVVTGLAFGPGAGGALHNHFIMNQSNVEKWTELVKNKIKPVMAVQAYSQHYGFYKSISEMMEQGILDFKYLEKFNSSLFEIYKPILEQWEKVGLLVLKGDKMKLTLAGEYWQVTLTQMLLHRIKSQLEK